jgi:mannose-6-phosphate isomerase-like protein (cupin superfamily)
MPLYKVWETPGVKVPPPNERVLKVILSPEVTGTKNLSLLISIISPHYTTGLHTHDQDEIMYVATGNGESIIGEVREPVTSDMIIHAPAGVTHEVKNTGDETLKLVCFYSPPLKPTGFYGEAIELARKTVKK